MQSAWLRLLKVGAEPEAIEVRSGLVGDVWVCCWGKGALALGVAFLGGCALVGYDPVLLRLAGEGKDAAPVDDVPSSPDAATQADDRFDAASGEQTSSLDAARNEPRLDAQPDGNRDIEAASADASAEASVCAAVNACSGCVPLAHEVGTACGKCGLGSYVCDGTAAVVCSGGDAVPIASGGTVLIDDLEDGDRNVPARATLSGLWFTVQDGTGGTLSPASSATLVPVSGGAAGSARAMHVSGSGFTQWGAGVGMSLSAYQCSYDATAQKGITFYAKGTGKLLVSAATLQTVPVSGGGSCTGACNDHFHTTFTLTNTWTPYTVPWTALKQAGWGTSATFLPSAMRYLQWSFGANITFDVWVDTVSFY